MNNLRLFKEIIKKSGFFDEKFYLFVYRDVSLCKVDPIEHYLYYGWKELRYPSVKFNTKLYLENYDDVRLSGFNPLLHYILYGKKEERDTFAIYIKFREFYIYEKLLSSLGRQTFIKDIKHKDGEKVKFIIYAMPFDETRGGSVVLHRLCHLLNEYGESAYIWPWSIGKEPDGDGICKSFNTPLAKISDLSDNAIVVYPEDISGNPLMAKNVVRWLLYKPGFFTGEVNYGKGELFFYLQKEYIPPEFNIPEENRLFVGLSFLDVYKQTNFGARKGTCYILRKGKNRKIVHNIKNSILIDGKSHKEIAEIFNNTKCCISYDLNTAYVPYAAICGCLPIVIPETGLSRKEWCINEEDCYGSAYGFRDIDYAKKTREKLLLEIKLYEKATEESVKKFAQKCKSFFNSN